MNFFRDRPRPRYLKVWMTSSSFIWRSRFASGSSVYTGRLQGNTALFFKLIIFVILFHFSGEISPALPPKRKSIYASSPAESSSTPIPPPLPSRSSGGVPTTFAVNGSGTVDETKAERAAEQDNLPALPPKKSVSRMSAEVDLSPVSQVRNGWSLSMPKLTKAKFSRIFKFHFVKWWRKK